MNKIFASKTIITLVFILIAVMFVLPLRYSLAQAVSAIASTTAPTGVSFDWITDSCEQRSICLYKFYVSFNYTANLADVKSFRLYIKKPGESSFSRAVNFDNPSSLKVGSGCSSVLSSGTWRLNYCYQNNYEYWVIRGQGEVPSFYPAGEYNAYMTTIDNAGIESSASSITKSVLGKTTLSSPIGKQNSTKPTFRWSIAISNWQAGTFFPGIFDSAGKSFWYKPVGITTGAGEGLFTYDGPKLRATLTYYADIHGTGQLKDGTKFYLMSESNPSFSVTASDIIPPLTQSFVSVPTSTPISQDNTALIKQLQALIISLQAQINDLKAKLEITRTDLAEVKEEVRISRNLSLGISGDDVKQLQEVLKQDPEIYPEGLVTGFFGQKTAAAVKRFQEKHGIESIGSVGPKTLAKVNELITSSFAKALEDKQGALVPRSFNEGGGKSGVILPGSERKFGTTTPAQAPLASTPSGIVPAQPIGQTGSTTIPTQLGITTGATSATITTTATTSAVSAIPAQPVGQTGVTTVPATPAVSASSATPVAMTSPSPSSTPVASSSPTSTPSPSPTVTATVASLANTGACSLSSSSGSSFYVNKSGVNILSALQSACTSTDYKTLLQQACNANSGFSGQEGVITRDANANQNSSTCGSFGCATRKCSQLATYDTTITAGSCYLTTGSASSIVYQDSDSGTGYAKKNIDGSDSITAIRNSCTKTIYDTLLTTLCTNSPSAAGMQESVAVFDVKGSGVTFGCAGLSCVSRSCSTPSSSSPPPVPSGFPPTRSYPLSGNPYSSLTSISVVLYPDSNGDTVKGVFDWGDGTTSEGTAEGHSLSEPKLIMPASGGTYVSAEHSYSTIGIYNIKVKAVDATNLSSAWTPSESVTIGIAPAQPVLTVTVSGSNVILNWTESSTDVTGFKLYDLPSSGGWRLPDVGGSVRTYTDSGRAPGTYEYYIQAYNLSGGGTVRIYSDISTPIWVTVTTSTTTAQQTSRDSLLASLSTLLASLQSALALLMR